MKIYFEDKEKGKHYINVQASTRQELKEKLKLKSAAVYVNGETYNLNKNFKAEPTNLNSGIIGLFAGALLGFAGGPIGSLIGAIVGGGNGKAEDNIELRKANHFNQTQVI